MANDSQIFEIKMVRERVKILFSPSQLKCWFDAKWSRRFMAYRGKVLVVFTVDAKGNPTEVDRLTCSDIELYPDTGLASTWKRKDGSSITVDTIPYEIAHQTYLWHTYNSEVQYSLKVGSGYDVRFSMLMKSRHSINFEQKDTSAHYILELSAFNERFWQ